MASDFLEFFRQATTYEPFPYQVRFAEQDPLPDLITAPTSLGKLSTIIIGWLWRQLNWPEKTPRRLVYCLPTRVLVEQAYQETNQWLARLGLQEKVGLYLLMGGAVAKDWDVEPENPCILVGTQEQLISRALNRGYAMSRYRWPMQFAQLNNDVLWVLDETQLMGVTPATAAQLQGLRDKLGTYGPTHTIWMSATLDPAFLTVPDFTKSPQILSLTEEDLDVPTVKQRLEARKRLERLSDICLPARNKEQDNYAQSLAEKIQLLHKPKSLTLVICNRPDRAQTVFRYLQKRLSGFDEALVLIHSRFRPAERQQQMAQVEAFRTGQQTGILVTTQAVEAGVDLSAETLITELAPPYALIQRFGRCNRKGEYEEARVFWVDINDKADTQPYAPEELKQAREWLESLQGDASLENLKKFPVQGPPVEGTIPRKDDIFNLFDTSVDLAGHDIDVSRFIRNMDSLDVYVAWRNWNGERPDAALALCQEELCPVPIGNIKRFLKAIKEKGWVWHNGEWVRPHSLYPGQRLLLPCSAGGYDPNLGYTGNPKDEPSPVLVTPIPADSDEQDCLSFTHHTWVTLADHSRETAQQAEQLCQKLLQHWSLPVEKIVQEAEQLCQQLPQQWSLPVEKIVQAAQWHDVGKAHPQFQAMLCNGKAPPKTTEVWAKAPKGNPYRWPPDRRGFRHELASALIVDQADQNFLVVYLVAAHHGKVRLVVQDRPWEIRQDRLFALGIHDRDEIPAVDLGNGLTIPPLQLSLKRLQLGTDTWVEKAYQLLENYGPFRLAFLEMLVRVADWRASLAVNSMQME